MQGEDGHDSTEHLCAIRCTQIRQMCTQMHSDALRDGHDSTEHRDVVDAFQTVDHEGTLGKVTRLEGGVPATTRLSEGIDAIFHL